jgi:uncharacterized phage protein (TIGR02220 family)
MNFLDGYYETASKMRSQAARAEYFAAIIDYYYKGEEPEFESEAAEIGFTAMRYSLDKARAGRNGGKASKSKPENKRKRTNSNENRITAPSGDMQPNPNETPSKRRPNANQNGTEAERKPNETPTKEEEQEQERVPSDEGTPPTPFGLACLAQLNEVMGTSYLTLPPKNAGYLAGIDAYTVEDVRRMVEYKADEWRGTRFACNLTPNTLFSPDHFEQYIYQSRSSAAEKSEYDIYD